jgi:hypothetical protein
LLAGVELSSLLAGAETAAQMRKSRLGTTLFAPSKRGIEKCRNFRFVAQQPNVTPSP